MFEISALKEKKISELQEIATELGIKKITALKKMELAYKIIDHYAANPTVSEEKIPQKIEAEKKEIKTEEKPVEETKKVDAPIEVKTEKSVSNTHKPKPNHFVKKEKNHNKDIRNRYKEPDLNSMELLKVKVFRYYARRLWIFKIF